MDKQGTNMRLSCPNCGAQYEVPAEVIPQDGRDVQCSNCGHTWFQLHPDDDIELARETGASLPDEGWSPETEPAMPAAGMVDDPAAAALGAEVQPPEPIFDDEVDEQQPETAEIRGRQRRPDTALPATADRAASAQRAATADDRVDARPVAKAADPAAPASAAPAGAPPVAAGPGPEPVFDAPQQGGFEPQAAHDMQADDREEADTQDDADTGDTEAAPGTTMAPARRGIDASVADVLRQEAEYEAQVREAEARDLLETQTEMSLETAQDGASARAEEARLRMRRIRGLSDVEPTPTESEPPETPDMASRRDLLPDIEEINSTLRSTDGRKVAEGDVTAISARARRRSGFRLGLGVTMLCAAALILAYVYNQDIVAAAPGSEPYVAQFMDLVNALRVWLDTQVTDAMLWLNQKADAAQAD